MAGPDGMTSYCFPPGGPDTVVYCCSTDTDCPISEGLGGVAGRCADVGTAAGFDPLRICIYDGARDFCTAADGVEVPSLMRFADCISEASSPVDRVVDYDRGGCDGDDLANGMDPCPCDPSNTCSTIGGDAGMTEADSGPGEEDAGATVDSGRGAQDAGPKDAGDPGTGAAPGIRFHGAGGCECTAAPGRPGRPAPLAGLVLAVLALALYSSCGMRSRGLRK
jgi:hypothetical protein